MNFKHKGLKQIFKRLKKNTKYDIILNLDLMS